MADDFDPDEYVVTTAEVGRMLDVLDQDGQVPAGLLPLIQDGIRAAQGAVVAYLHQPVMPAQYTEHHAWSENGRWMLSQYPVLEVVSATPETDSYTGYESGFYTVVYRAGIDARNDPACEEIRTFVKYGAANWGPLLTKLQGPPWERKGEITSVSTEQQSVRWAAYRVGAGDAKTAGAAGGPPVLDDLAGWKKKSGRRRRPRPIPAGPGSGDVQGSRYLGWP